VDFITRPAPAEEVVARVRTHVEHRRLTRDLVARNEDLRRLNESLQREVRRREEAEASLERVDEQLSLVSRQEARRWGIEALVGRAPAMARVVADVRKLQALPSTPVLITGESGTGKELVARAIHFGSARGRAAFVAVNCAAVPSDLAESLFFGHVKGAFSGALRDGPGYLGNAHGGTLFLDEIGDMPPALQAKLLRALEGGTVLAVGADRERAIDVRVVAATHCDLRQAIAAGVFRSDLFFRLAHAVLEVPPLRDRREDIALLASHFLEELASEMGMPPPRLGPGTAAALERYDFPGNVRELRNLIERALIESGGADLLPEHLQFVFLPLPHGGSRAGGESAGGLAAGSGVGGGHRQADEERILAYVRTHGGINNATCRELLGVGMHRAWYLLRRLHRAGMLLQEHSGRWAQYRLP
jgi:DNA-binding NtrC family response regulator